VLQPSLAEARASHRPAVLRRQCNRVVEPCAPCRRAARRCRCPSRHSPVCSTIRRAAQAFSGLGLGLSPAAAGSRLQAHYCVLSRPGLAAGRVACEGLPADRFGLGPPSQFKFSFSISSVDSNCSSFPKIRINSNIVRNNFCY
jgi:hypothetical protein